MRSIRSSTSKTYSLRVRVPIDYSQKRKPRETFQPSQQAVIAPAPVQPPQGEKRGRGRPRKTANPGAADPPDGVAHAESSSGSAAAANNEVIVVASEKTRGRKRKQTVDHQSAGKLSKKTKRSVSETVEESESEVEESESEPELQPEAIDSETTHIHKLPNTVLGLIFRKMSILERLRMEQICRRWQHVSLYYAWNDVRALTHETLFVGETETRAYRAEMTNKHIVTLLDRAGKYLRCLDLGSFHAHGQFTYHICKALEKAPNLQHLNLSYVQLTNSVLRSIGNTFPKLKSIAMRRCFASTLMERGLTSLLTSCDQLEMLDLGENERFLGTSFQHLPHTLTDLNISSCFRVLSQTLAEIHNNCPLLKSLNMDNIDLINPTELNAMFQRLTNLESLNFSEVFHSHMMDDDLRGNIVTVGGLKKLKELVVHDNLLVNDTVLRAIGFGCRSLQVLDISQCTRGVTDTGLRFLAHLPVLTELKFQGHRQLTDATLIEIARRGILKDVVVRRCTNISDESIVSIIKQCKELNSLDVSWCANVTKKSFVELNKTIESRHGKASVPTKADEGRRFRLKMNHSGIPSTLLKKVSPWIRVDDDFDNPPFNFPGGGLLIAHFMHLPFVIV